MVLLKGPTGWRFLISEFPLYIRQLNCPQGDLLVCASLSAFSVTFCCTSLKEYLAHKTPPPPPGTIIGP